MTAKKKEATRDVKLTTAQVGKLGVYSAQLNLATKQLQDYYAGIMDANEIVGTWEARGIEDGVLKLRKKG